MIRVKLVVLLISISVLVGCANGRMMTLNSGQVDAVNKVYDPLIERAFCLKSDGIWNIREGGIMTCEMPLCNRSDIVVHTHPQWAEKDVPYLSIDWVSWGEYKKRYGNDLFGLMIGPGEIKLYER